MKISPAIEIPDISDEEISSMPEPNNALLILSDILRPLIAKLQSQMRMNAKRGKLFLDLIHSLAGFFTPKSGFWISMPCGPDSTSKNCLILEPGLPYMRQNRGAHHQSS